MREILACTLVPCRQFIPAVMEVVTLLHHRITQALILAILPVMAVDMGELIHYHEAIFKLDYFLFHLTLKMT
jgi:hypothetical protein